jgi:biopolymer transport protein ExbD
MASKKLRLAQGGAGDDLKVDMSPMIDMVFLLLIFFLVNATMKVVKMDKKVVIPIASTSKRQETKAGRIVINVYSEEHSDEGRFRDAGGKNPFLTDDAMVEYIKKQKGKMDDLGVVPKIHLRGDKDVKFTYIRRVIRSAAKAGVNQVVFVSYSKAPIVRK